MEFNALVVDEEEENEFENLVESGNERNETSDELVVHLNNLIAFVERKNMRIIELEQTTSQHVDDKVRLSNEIIQLRTNGQEKDATINELRKQIARLQAQPGPSIQPFAGPRQQEGVGGVDIAAQQNVNAVQGAVSMERGSVSRFVNWNHPPRTREVKKVVLDLQSGPQGASVQATTRPDNHQQRDEAVPKKRIFQQATRSVIEGRMGLHTQNLPSNAEPVGSRGEDSGNPPHYVDPRFERCYRKCVCGKRLRHM